MMAMIKEKRRRKVHVTLRVLQYIVTDKTYSKSTESFLIP